MADNLLAFFGYLGMKQAERYARVDKKRLPEPVKELLLTYRQTLAVMLAAAIFPLAHARLWTVCIGMALAIGCYLLKSSIEKKLTPALEPYMQKQDKA